MAETKEGDFVVFENGPHSVHRVAKVGKDSFFCELAQGSGKLVPFTNSSVVFSGPEGIARWLSGELTAASRVLRRERARAEKSYRLRCGDCIRGAALAKANPTQEDGR